jgi:hypothetical protein
MRKYLLWLATLLLMTVFSTSAHSVILAWTETASGVTGYNVYREVAGATSFTKLTPVPITSLSFQDSTVVNGTNYLYYVTAMSGLEESSPSTSISAAVPATTAPTLTNLVVTLGGTNALVSAIENFSDGSTQNVTNLTLLVIPTTPSATATFIGIDTATEGSWLGVYGKDGFSLANSSASIPTYATLTPAASLLWTWAATTADTRALQLSLNNGRIATCWYAASPFSFGISIIDGNPHKVSLYALDWDSRGRTETISVLNATTGAVLDTRQVTNFNNGVWYSWTVSGNVRFVVTYTAGVNGVISGIFFN